MMKVPKRRRQPNFFRIGLLTLIVVVGLSVLGFRKDNPLYKPYEFKAAFTTVHDLKPRSSVRIAGVEVGKVVKVETVGDNQSAAGVATIQIRDRGLPIHEDATLKVRPRLFLEGNYFVDLKPGSPSAPELQDGGTIPATQTAAPVGVGEVLSALQSDTRADLRRVFQEYGEALEGAGAKGYNRSTKYWKAAYQNNAIVSDATRGILEHDLSRYIASSADVAAGLNRSPERLRALITNLAQTATAFASEQQNLSAAIDELPRTLRQGYRTLGTLNDAFPAVRRFARDMTPAVRTSPATLDAQLPFVKQLRGLVSEEELGGLAKRLRHWQNSLFTFLDRPDADWHNNFAERQIRPAVILRKNSQCNRSRQGAATQAVLMSVHRTLKLRGIDPRAAIDQALRAYTATGTLPPLPSPVADG